MIEVEARSARAGRPIYVSPCAAGAILHGRVSQTLVFDTYLWRHSQSAWFVEPAVHHVQPVPPAHGMMLFGGRRLDVHRSRPSNRLPFGRPRFIILEAEPVGRESCRRTRIGVKPAVRPSSGARASPSTRQPSQSARNAEASRLRGRFPPSTPRHPRKAERLVPGLTGASPRNWQDHPHPEDR